MDRRCFLLTMAGGLATSALSGAGQNTPSRSRLGIARFSCNIRGRAERSGQVAAHIGDPLDFLKYCHGLGAGGIQDGLGSRDESYTDQLRRYAEGHDLFIEGSASLPRDRADVERFDAHVRTAKRAGATVIRVAIGGRRYEQFDRLEQFRAFAERSERSIQLAEPVAARGGIRLAIENHKDFRVPEMVGMLERLDSEYVGVCVDTGNSFALLEDPMDVVRAYAPWAFAAHLKDMAVREYEDGFLLADVVLGEGLLDLGKMVAILRRARPEIKFSLEMATRDALKVPCLTEKYWATFPGVPGADLASALRYVRAHAGGEAFLPRVGHLSVTEQVALEEQNIKRCLRYAREHLNL
ncbi:MAG: sugar phosphate isomerase/epimerase family protein [Planctomycetota bacterium]|jgi:sugar phosphate isomerase/epimerase